MMMNRSKVRAYHHSPDDDDDDDDDDDIVIIGISEGKEYAFMVSLKVPVDSCAFDERFLAFASAASGPPDQAQPK